MTKAKEALDATLEGALWVCKGYDQDSDTRLMRRLEPQEINTIRRALRILDKIESGEMLIGERPTWETGDPQWWDECAKGYNQCLDDLRGIE